MDDIYSNIAIDLGGKYTGFISYTIKDKLEKQDINAAIIEMPDQGNGLSYTVKDRTAVRHHIRSEDRFKKARRLIFSVIEYKIKRPMSDDEKEAVSSLMRRRGYTRLESEVDLDILKNCSPDIFALFSSDKKLFDNDSSLYDQFVKKCNDVESAKIYRNFFNNHELAELIADIEDKDAKELYKSSLEEMKAAAENIIKQEEFGHKPRKIYLENIKKDIDHDSRLKAIIESFDSSEKLYKCIGNISNLQLRALRWYFNDKNMRYCSELNNQRLKDVWIRALQFFHYPDSTSGNSIKTLIQKIRKTNNCIDALSNIDPILTIPPYEDQNNRRPPVDQTLLLSPEVLDRMYGSKWLKWIDGFVRLLPQLTDDLDKIIKLTDRKNCLDKNKANSYTLTKKKYAYIFHRLLDLSFNRDIEITKIRAWAVNPKSNKLIKLDNIIKSVTGDDYYSFLKLVSSYYDEVKLAKEGLWSVVKSPLMELSGIHPPMKRGILSELVAGVLNIHTCFDYEKFKDIWNSKIIKNSTVRSICKSIEEKRKNLGNAFNFEYSRTLYVASRNGEKNLKAEQKALFTIKNQVDIVSKFIGKKLNLDDINIAKFANPYSLAQLYTLIETDIHGFSSNCLAVNIENNCRMRATLGSGAFCSRLPAEAVRPFDGSLGKILKRQAYEIAKKKVLELKEFTGIKNSRIHLGILIEENQFEFSASIAKIKKSKFATKIRKVADKGVTRQEEYYLNKEDRIKKASRGICPYTGGELTEKTHGEIDHIIPRSLTKERMGTIFNTEANLIYTSQRGNQLKDERIYTLENLHPKYLLAVFGTSDISVIRNIIDDTIDSIEEKNDRFLFELMSEQERDCCRHALFLPGTHAYDVVVAAMAKQYSTRVNGTQSWFIREVIYSVLKELGQWLKDNGNTIDFFTSKIDVMNMSKPFRDALGKINSALTKKNPQPITSHAIDALCVLAGAITDKRISAKIGGSEDLTPITYPERLAELVPDNYEIIRISRKNFTDKDEPQSRKLYKDTIYAENFIPVMVRDHEIKIGFDWGANNVIVTKGHDKFLKLLSPLFTEEYKFNAKFHTYRIDKHKAFLLLHQVHSNNGATENLALEQSRLLKSLYYTTQSMDVYSVVYNPQKNAFSTKNEIIKDKNFNIEISNPPKNIKFSGKTLTLPSKKEWNDIGEKLSDLLGNKISDISEIINKDPYAAIDSRLNHKINCKSDHIYHKSVKRVYSIPMIASPSGGIRILRQDMNGNAIFQTVAANTPDTVLSKGFLVKDDKIDWKNKVNVEAYSGINLTILKGGYNNISGNHVSMDEIRTIYKNGETIIRIAPGTEGRRIVYVEQSFENFNNCMNKRFKSYFDIPSEIKLSHDEIKLLEAFEQNLGFDKLGNPRNGIIKVTNIGITVKFNYKLQSSDQINLYYDRAN